MYLLKMNLKITDSSLFIGQSCFNNDGSQSCLLFQLLYYTLIILVRQKRTTPSTTDNCICPSMNWYEIQSYV